MNLQRTRSQHRPKKPRGAQMYLTLVTRNMSACLKAFTVASSFRTKVFHELLGISKRSHTHGSNRNRIALHVMLNGRRNRILC